MIKKLLVAVASITTLVSMTSLAGINVQYYNLYGIYPNGGDGLSGTPGTGLLAANGTGSTLIQLVYAGGDGVANGGVTGIGTTGDDQVLQSRVVSIGGGFDEWGYIGTFPAPYTNPTFTSGNVFVRVFQTETPGAGQFYYDTATLTLEDRNLDIAFTQTLVIDSPSAGIILNLPIVPEPSVMAFMGLGGLVMAVRRRLRKA